MLPNYQLKITDFYNIPINNVKKSAPAFFDQEKYVIHYVNLQPYLRLGLKLKANNAFQNSNGDKDGKDLYKLKNNYIYQKTMENVRKIINVRIVNNEKD